MVKTGLEILLRSHLDLLKDRRVGFVTHPPAVLPDLTHGLDALLGAGIRVVALFGPEHGFDSSAADGASVEHGVDRRTGLPVYSLYGPDKEPSPAMLADVDVLIIDLQDVGARFYTFISTLFYVLRGAAVAGKPAILLDRPNPINGRQVSGPTVAPGFESFVGIAPMPVRHGLTAGELAGYFNTDFGFRADLTVVPLEGWRREMWFDDTGLPWIPLSPGMPHLTTATVYPGMCFLEGTNLSEGRGTALPFEIAGAPWLDRYRLAQKLNGLNLPGARFRPVSFIPTSSKHANQACQGIQAHVTNRETFDPILAGLQVIAACKEQAPGDDTPGDDTPGDDTPGEFAFLESSWEGGQPHFDLLAGSARLRGGLAEGVPVDELAEGWIEDLKRFEPIYQKNLLYA